MPPLLLSKSQPLRWVAIWFRVQPWQLRHLYCCDVPEYCRELFCSRQFFTKAGTFPFRYAREKELPCLHDLLFADRDFTRQKSICSRSPLETSRISDMPVACRVRIPVAAKNRTRKLAPRIRIFPFLLPLLATRPPNHRQIAFTNKTDENFSFITRNENVSGFYKPDGRFPCS